MGVQGEEHPRAKITEDAVKAIRSSAMSAKDPKLEAMRALMKKLEMKNEKVVRENTKRRKRIQMENQCA